MATQIVINTSAAERNIAELNNQVESLTRSIADLDAQEKQLNATLAKSGSLSSAEAKQLQQITAARKEQTAALAAANAELKVNNKALAEQEAKLKRSTTSARDLARMFGGTLGRTIADISEGIEKFGDISFSAFLKGANGARLFKLALIGTGVGALIVALGSLVAYFATTEQGAKEFKATMDDLKDTFRPILTLLQYMGSALLYVARGFKEFNGEALLTADTLDSFQRIIQNAQQARVDDAVLTKKSATATTALIKAEIELSNIREDDYNARIAKLKEIQTLTEEFIDFEKNNLIEVAKLAIETADQDKINLDKAIEKRAQLAYIANQQTDQRDFAKTVALIKEQDVVLESLSETYSLSAAAGLKAQAALKTFEGNAAKTQDSISKRQLKILEERKANNDAQQEAIDLANAKRKAELEELFISTKLSILERERLQIELDRLNALEGVDSGPSGEGRRLEIEKKYIQDVADFKIESEELVGEARELVQKQAEADIQKLQSDYEAYIDAQNAANIAANQQKQALADAAHEQELSRIQAEKSARLQALSEVANAFIAIADLAAEGSKEQKALAIIAATINGLVAGIKAYAELGPVLGGIAAGAIAVSTGAAIASIRAQEVPDSNLEVPGFQVGGYTGYGRPDDVAGLVHKGEYVVPAGVLGTTIGASLVAGLEGLRTGINVPQQGNIADQVVAGLRRSPIFVRVQDIVGKTNQYVQVVDSANY